MNGLILALLTLVLLAVVAVGVSVVGVKRQQAEMELRLAVAIAALVPPSTPIAAPPDVPNAWMEPRAAGIVVAVPDRQFRKGSGRAKLRARMDARKQEAEPA